MNDALEKLKCELGVVRHTLAEAEARYAHHEKEHKAIFEESEKVRKQIEQAHREWVTALDVVEDLIFMYDEGFHILRCNRAYQQIAGIPFKQVIGQLYYEVFPKTHAPLPNSLRVLEKAEESEEAEEVIVGDTTYRSHVYSVTDSQGSYLYSVHTLEDINERLHANQALRESELQYRRLFESAKDGILMLDADSGKIIDANPFTLNLLSYSLSECTAKMLWEIGLFKDVKDNKEAFRELQDKRYIRYEDLPLVTKDGRQIDVEFISNLYEIGERKVIQCSIRDISERVSAKRLLQESERQYRRLFESAKDGILLLDAETGKVTDANPFILNLLSYSLDECKGKMLWEIGLFKDIASSKEAFQELQDKRYIRYEDLPLKTKDGQRREVEFVSNVYEVGGRKVIQCNIRDITESLRAKESLIASHDLLQKVVENTPVRVFWKDTELRFLGCNSAFACDAGMSSPEEVIGKDDFQMVWAEQAERYRSDDRQVMDTGVPILGREEPQTTPDGRIIWLHTSKVPLRTADGNIFGMLGIYEDISESREAEKSLKLFRTLLDNSSDAIEVLDPETLRFLDVNETECRDLGYSREELLSMCVLDIDAGFDEESLNSIQQQIQAEGSARFDSVHRRKDGSTFPVEVSAKLIELDRPYLLSIVRDITERKHNEESLRRANRALKTLSAGNLALVQAEDEDGLLCSITRVIVEQGGYSLAVVDYAEDDPEKSITPMAWSGFEGNHYWVEHLSWADTERGQLPVSGAIRSGTTQVCHDVVTDPAFDPWREAVQARGYQANIALPLRDEGKTFGGLSIYSNQTDAFDEEEIPLLEELANDLAYGIGALRARKAHEQHAIILRQSLEQFIQAIASTVEARDPYTAGHQRRVADLATAIAREMELPEEQVNGIHLAGIIHDLGKIRVPAEILSKPGKLSAIEFQLIQVHPQAGYDILKEVRFPWPIATIILQHHEKLDGSGYPQGLKDEQILLEAKILSVADVVEAMSSHRPYRAGLGVEVALAEIEAQRGVLFEPMAVDACIKLFRECDYTIPD